MTHRTVGTMFATVPSWFPFFSPPLPMPSSIDPGSKTVAELRELVSKRPRGLQKLLSRLEEDERAGVRAIAAAARRRQRAERAERARVGRLLRIERSLHKKGIVHIAGVDEAGRGPIAGPVVAAAVLFPVEVAILGVDDSKALKPEQRAPLFDEIHGRATSIGVGQCDADEIDRLNIHVATLTAMRRAIQALRPAPERILIDGSHLPKSGFYEMALVKGDSRSHAIAAASVVAKVTRDRILCALDAQHPGYGLAHHKGYASEDHLNALKRLGPSPIHRQSFHLNGFHTPAYRHFRSQIDQISRPEDLHATAHDLKAARLSLPPRAFKELQAHLRQRETQLNRTGPAGERIAETELMRDGYLILERNVRLRGGEIDLIAQTGDVIAFIEVKSAGPHGFGAPERRVTTRKQQQIARLAEAYLHEHATTLSPRFDVVSVEMATEPPTAAIFKDAFRA